MTESLIALISALLLLLGTPGPATLGLAAIGATFGVRGGLSFLGGILVGLCITIAGAAAGLAALLAAYPSLRITLQFIGGAYVCYLAYKIATAPVANNPANIDPGKAPRFRDGVILNVLNPKAYASLLAIFTSFLLPLEPSQLALATTAIVCLAVGIVVDIAWLAFGNAIAPLFRRPRAARALRINFAVLMVAAVGWALTR